MTAEFFNIPQVAAAIMTATFALAAWIAKRIHDVIAEIVRARRKRREIVIRFYTDVKLRVEYCAKMGDRGRFKEVVRRYDAERPFSAYVAQVTDRSAYELIESVLHTFPVPTIEAVRRFIVSDTFAALMYEKLATKQFAALQIDRKMAVIDAFYDEIDELQRLGRTVLSEIEYLAPYGDVRKWKS
jgi:hypothetical protein